MEEKGPMLPHQRRHHLSESGAQGYTQMASGGGNGPYPHAASSSAASSAIAAVEARLSAQVAQAASQHDAHQTALAAGMGAPPPPLPTLPLSSGSAPLRPATLAATLAGQQGGSGVGGVGVSSLGSDLHALEWSDQQFLRAGVHTLPSVDSRAAHSTPIQNLGMQQRLRHAHLLSSVDKVREGQQHIFLEQLNQLPNVESHTAADYRRIWHAFKDKDEQSEHVLAKLATICDSIDAINRHANHAH